MRVFPAGRETQAGSVRIGLRSAGLLSGVAHAGGDDHAPASGGGDGDAFEHPLFPPGNDDLQFARHFAVEVANLSVVFFLFFVVI